MGDEHDGVYCNTYYYIYTYFINFHFHTQMMQGAAPILKNNYILNSDKNLHSLCKWSFTTDLRISVVYSDK